MDHRDSGEYTFKGSGESHFWTSPLTQYCTLNLLILRLDLFLHIKAYVLEIILLLEK